MQYGDLVYGLLQSLAWSIVPALPLGSAGTRLPVGTPEKIPDVTFITRAVTAADGIEPAAERTRLNGYIDGARRYHTIFGLNPRSVGSFEDVLDHFHTATAPVGRIRFISHGDNAFIFCPMFIGGKWDFGMQEDFLQALGHSDENGLRFLFANAVSSPLFIDVVDAITDAIRTRNSAVLAPFGIQAAGSPPAAALPYFEIVNDLYQVRYGTVTVDPLVGAVKFPTAAQTTIFTNALNLIEASVRGRLVGTVIAAAAVTDPQLTAFRDAVLAVAPGPFGLFGGPVNLPAGTVAAVNTATTAVPQVENDIRMAFTGGAVSEPVFGINQLPNLFRGLQMFNAAVLNIGAAPPLALADVTGDADLNSLALVGVDLFLLQNGVVLENGVALTAAQRTTLRNGLLALASFARGRITGRVPPPLTAAQLNALRDAIANLDSRKSTILGFQGVFEPRITDLHRATIAMQNDFRTKLDHFCGLMQPADASSFDVRGCLVGQSTSYLDTLRAFLGTAANRPVVTAPDWFQSFPAAFVWRTNSPIRPDVDGLVAGGSPPQIRAVDVGTSLTTWRGLIDFDPHFDFIVALFATGASRRDFASLHWRVFQGPAAPHGIPVLRMQAKRVDDLDTQTLGNVIERFRIIFEIPAASAPNAATRTRLDSLQPHVVRFKTLSDAVAATTSPTATQLTQFITDLSALLTSVTAVGLPGPAAPTAPAGSALADVQGYVTAIGTYLDALLDGALAPFFAAMQAATASTVANAAIRYFYNCGLPLLLQNDGTPTSFLVSAFVSPSGAAGSSLVADAIRSWMRIQWQGTAAQAGTMNTTITAVPITNDTERTAASRVSMLSEDDPGVVPNAPAGIAPTPTFAAHIIKRPP